MKFSINDLFSEVDQMRSYPLIWSHLLKKSLTENFIFCKMLSFTKDFLQMFEKDDFIFRDILSVELTNKKDCF